jgi:hypothetical protein
MRARLAIAVAVSLGFAALVVLLRRSADSAAQRATSTAEAPTTPMRSADAAASAPAETPTPPFATRILADYANPSRPPEEDLHAVARMLGNFALLVKGSDPLPLGANEEIAAALRGKNQASLRALPDDHRAFNAQGQLVDRWATPFYFHAESRDRVDVRSAGPDRRMWTADDLHRKHDGRFLRGEALLAPSLFDEKPAVR